MVFNLLCILSLVFFNEHASGNSAAAARGNQIDPDFHQELKRVCKTEECISTWSENYTKCPNKKCQSSILLTVRSFSSSKRNKKETVQVQLSQPFKGQEVKVNQTTSEISVPKIEMPKSSARKTESITLAPSTDEPVVDTQRSTMNQARTHYLENCKTLDCAKTVEKRFDQLTEGNNPQELTKEDQNKISEEVNKLTTADGKNSAIPEEVKNIFLNQGPFSDEMISYFKSHPEIIYKKESLNLSKNNKKYQESLNCDQALIKEECEKYLSQADIIHHISNYFGYSMVNGPNSSKVKIPGPGYELTSLVASYSNGHAPHSIYCKFNPERLPYFNQEDKKSLFNSPEGGVSGRNLKDCDEKLKPFKEKFLQKIESIGNPPTGYTISVNNPAGIMGPYITKLKGDCYGFIFMPPKDEIGREIKWFSNTQNERVIKKFELKNVTNTQCDYEKNKLISKLDPSQYHDMSYFLGKTMSLRMTSKLKYSDRLRTSRPVCQFSYRTGGALRRLQTNQSDLTLDGTCTNFCQSREKSLLESQKTFASQDPSQPFYTEFKCELIPNIFEMISTARTQDVYKFAGEDNKKVCEHFNYELSQNPILKFFASDEEDCLKPKNQDKSYIAGSTGLEAFYNVEVRFDGKNIFNTKKEVSCTASYGGATNGYVPSSSKTVRSKDECYSMCKEYHQQITPLARDSASWVECSANNHIINFDYFDQIDPLIVITPNSSKPRSPEEVMSEYFENH